MTKPTDKQFDLKNFVYTTLLFKAPVITITQPFSVWSSLQKNHLDKNFRGVINHNFNSGGQYFRLFNPFNGLTTSLVAVMSKDLLKYGIIFKAEDYITKNVKLGFSGVDLNDSNNYLAYRASINAGLIATGLAVSAAMQPLEFAKNHNMTKSTIDGKTTGLVDTLRNKGLGALKIGFKEHMKVSALGLICLLPVNEMFSEFYKAQAGENVDVKNRTSASTAIFSTFIALGPTTKKVRVMSSVKSTGSMNPSALATAFLLDIVVKTLGVFATASIVNRVRPDDKVSAPNAAIVKPNDLGKS